MMLDLLNNICIDIHCYQPDAGWSVTTEIPDELLDTPMTVQIERPYKDEQGGWDWKTSSVEINASYFLEEMLDEIVNYVKSINDESGEYFEDHRFLEELMLDTDTMIATTSWGS